MTTISSKALFAIVTATVTLAPVAATAQHVDMLVWDDGGTIGVGEFSCGCNHLFPDAIGTKTPYAGEKW